jgi:hypothetical protein
VDINSASKAQLMTLPGIGEAEAKKIIAGRPFRSKARLVADNILPQAAYDALKGRIVAVQKTQPSAKTKPGKDPRARRVPRPSHSAASPAAGTRRTEINP